MKVKIKIEFEVSTDRNFKSPALQRKLQRAIIRGITPSRQRIQGDVDYFVEAIGYRMTLRSKELPTLQELHVKVSKPVVTAK